MDALSQPKGQGVAAVAGRDVCAPNPSDSLTCRDDPMVIELASSVKLGVGLQRAGSGDRGWRGRRRDQHVGRRLRAVSACSPEGGRWVGLFCPPRKKQTTRYTPPSNTHGSGGRVHCCPHWSTQK